jgi:hypothetical protein
VGVSQRNDGRKKSERAQENLPKQLGWLLDGKDKTEHPVQKIKDSLSSECNFRNQRYMKNPKCFQREKPRQHSKNEI